VFMARGPGLDRKSLPELSILDVAPMILHSLGLPVPSELEGTVPREAFAAGWLERHPVAAGTGAAAAPGASRTPSPGAAALSKDDEERLATHLRALGYIE